MENKRILFVDDEPNILSGLRRMLRSMRKEFDFYFAENGSEALDIMDEAPVDIIVSDMRMPGMDGASLLSEVQKIYPHSIRIMLTGQADDDSVMRTVGVVHQFLAKPCDPELLKTVLLRASALQDLMQNGQLKNIITGIDYLPSLPEIYLELQRKLKDPEVSIKDIANIIEEDIAMSAKVLQLVNSAFFGLFQKAETPARAVNLLGLETIKALALSVEVFSDKNLETTVIPLKELWSHSMAIGTSAKMITETVTENKDLIDYSLIAGVLHDIGKLVLVSRMSDVYKTIINQAREDQIAIQEAEQRIIGATHCDVGAYLIGLWGLQSSVVEAIAFQHRLDHYPADSFTPALAVHVANTLYYDFHEDEYIGVPKSLNEAYIAKLGLSDKIDQWREICKEIAERTKNDK